MRTIFLIVSLSLLAVAGSSRAETRQERYPNGRLKTVFHVDSQRRPHGRYVAYHPGGSVRVRGEYCRGERVGLWIHADERGYICGFEEFTTVTVVSASGQLHAVVGR